MNKIEQKVAEVLHQRHKESTCTCLPDLLAAEFEEDAQAAIAALDIIILPEGEKPQEGDIIITPIFEEVAEVDEKGLIHIHNMKGDTSTSRADNSCTIIQRNGIPVIQEGFCY